MLISRIPPYYTTAFGRPRNVVTARPAVWWRSARRPASQSAQLAPSAAKHSRPGPAAVSFQRLVAYMLVASAWRGTHTVSLAGHFSAVARQITLGCMTSQSTCVAGAERWFPWRIQMHNSRQTRPSLSRSDYSLIWFATSTCWNMQTQLVGRRLQAGAICDTTMDRPTDRRLTKSMDANGALS